MVSETHSDTAARGDAGPGPGRLSAAGSAVRRSAQRRRASRARRRDALPGRRPPPAPVAAALVASAPGTVALSPVERERRLDTVADHLVRTMRSVAVPGVPPFSRRDRLLFGGIVTIEAVVVGLMVAAAHR